MTERQFIERSAMYSAMLPVLLGRTNIEITNSVTIRTGSENIRAVLSTPHLKEALKKAADGAAVEVILKTTD